MEIPHGSVDLRQVDQDPAGPGLQLDRQEHLVCRLLQLTLLAEMPRGDKQALHLQAFRAFGLLSGMRGLWVYARFSSAADSSSMPVLVKMPR